MLTFPLRLPVSLPACPPLPVQKRRQRPPSRVRVYRIAPHCPEDPTFLVPKAVSPKPGCSHADWSLLDCRGCFLIHLPAALYVWRGSSCLGVMVEAGWRAAGGLVRYEAAPAAELVKQGGWLGGWAPKPQGLSKVACSRQSGTYCPSKIPLWGANHQAKHTR